MALVSRSRLPLHRSGREVGGNTRPFPLLSRQGTLPREPRAGRCKAPLLPPRWSFSSRTRKERVRTPARLPLLFSSASSQSAPSSGTSHGEGGGGRWPRGRRLQARGDRDPRLQPRPAMRAPPPPPLSPEAGRRGLQSRTRPRPTRRASAGTHPPQRLSRRPLLGARPPPDATGAQAKGEANSSLGSPRFLALSDNLFRETLREEDIFLNPLSGWGLPLPCGATSATLPSAKTPDHRGHVRETGS